MSDDTGLALLAQLGISVNDTTVDDNASVDTVETTDGANLSSVPAESDSLTIPDLLNLEQLPPVAEPEAPPVFTVQRMIFTSMLEQVMQVVPLRDNFPQFKNVLIEVFDDRLALTGSDSTSSVISSSTTVRVERVGRVLIGAARFASVVRRCDGAEIVVRCEGTSLHLASGGYSVSLRIAAEQDYPPLPQIDDVTWYEIDRASFIRALAGTRYAVSSDGNKDYCMQLDISGGVVTSTDDVRFAQIRDNLPAEFSCQLPASGADLLVKMLERNDATLFRMADTDFHIVAEIGPSHSPDRATIAHLMRDFPQEARNSLSAPIADNRDVLTIVADDLIEVLRRAAPTSDDETGAVALRVGSPTPHQVTVSTRNRYGDLSDEIIDASFLVSGTDSPASPRTIVVSHTHLREAVRAAVVASQVPADGEGAGLVLLFLGQPRSRSRPAFVLVSDFGRTVHGVLTQIRSDWLT